MYEYGDGDDHCHDSRDFYLNSEQLILKRVHFPNSLTLFLQLVVSHFALNRHLLMLVSGVAT